MLRQDERDRLKALHEVKQGHLTQRAAAEQLGISERWVREQAKGRVERCFGTLMMDPIENFDRSKSTTIRYPSPRYRFSSAMAV